MRKESRRDHDPIISSNGEAAEKADRLAPPEERAGQGSNNGGAIIVGTGELKIPNDFTGKDEGKKRLFGLEPIGLVILLFALAFIAFITYLISIEPPQVEDKPSAAVEARP